MKKRIDLRSCLLAFIRHRQTQIARALKKPSWTTTATRSLSIDGLFRLSTFNFECQPSEERWFEVELRQISSSLILRTLTTFKFYDIVNDKIIIKYEFARQKVAYEKEYYRDEGEYPSQFIFVYLLAFLKTCIISAKCFLICQQFIQF